MTVAELRALCESALGDANVQAFLRLIRYGESSDTNDDYAYHVRWGGIGQKPKRFESFADHPRILESGPLGPSSAAGAFGITMTTFDDFGPKIGVTDFTPRSQDLIALAIMEREHALADVLAGRIEAAIARLGGRWSSLPSNKDGQPTRKLEALLCVYAKWGGSRQGQPAAPAQPAPAPVPPAGAPPAQPEQPVMAPLVIPLVFGLVQSLLTKFAPQAQTQLNPIMAAVAGGASPQGAAMANQEAIAGFVQSIMNTVLQQAGNANPAAATDAEKIAATAMVMADQRLVTAVQDDALARLDKLGPTFDRLAAQDKAANDAALAGKDAASKRSLADRWDMTKATVLFSEALAVFVVALGAVLIGFSIYKDKWEIGLSILAVVGGWVTTMLKNRSQIYDYRYDGTPTSNASNAINAEIARK